MSTSWRMAGSYDPHELEKLVLKFWEDNKVYQLVKRETSKSTLFFNFIDGPPYPTGDVPHIGTAWNKSLKDAILRYMRMKGYRVNDRPGYDCHGLPIEVKVEQKLGIKLKKEIEEKIGIDRFIEECKKFAVLNLSVMTEWFKQLGVFMDWENPYLTLTDEYIEAAWWLIKQADVRGLLEAEHRVVHWCPRCSTTLAEYEVEYKDIEDPSIYVKFPLREEANTYLVVWTTTPWTLPANVFVMAHPDEVYVKVVVNGETWIMAAKRLEAVMKDCRVKNYEVVEEIPGEELVKYTYEHPLKEIVPLQEKLSAYHKVLLAPEYVSMYEGTGLVHAAPGHGFEDYEVALRYNLREAVVCPVNEEGKFTEEAGLFSGMNVREANEHIINALKEKNALIHHDTIVHRYPVCWRCKTPTILRATRQWVIKVTKLKEELKREASKVNWIPSWALTRLMNMVENVQDWVVSRQRYWGTPLPVWTCPNGHRVVIGSMEELVRYSGTMPKELHRPWIDQVTLECPYCSLKMKRVPDVVDVWLDSGVAFYASRGHPSKLGKEDVILDFIVEGHDQIRGWFFSLLRSGVLGFNVAPYRTVLVHGFMLDEQGREMHKSLGNYVGLDEAIEKAGRDPLRLWLLSNTVWEDVRFSWRELDEARRDLTILWNISVFAKTYMDVDRYDPTKHPLEKYMEVLKPEDKWILSRVNTLVRRFDSYMRNYDVAGATRLTRSFIVEDLSHWYIKLARPRVWIEENVAEKMAVYATLYYVLDRLVRLIAPITPFIAEYIYQALFRDYYGAPSVHVLKLPEVDSRLIDGRLEEYMDIVREVYRASSSARMKAGLKLRQPVRKITIYTDNEEVREALRSLSDIVRFMCNAKMVEIAEAKKIADITRYKVKPKYRALGPKYRDLVKRILEYVEMNADSVAKCIIERGVHRTIVAGVEIELTGEDVEIVPYYVEGFLVEDFKHGVVALDTRLTTEEVAEGLARDIIRRIQVMRKKLNLPLLAKIKVIVVAPTDRISLLEMKREYIMNETRSVELMITSSREFAGSLGGLVEEWDIDDELYVIEVMQAE
ncbi:MAG: isoleucine--tRNA ligase [Desulfurococcaceae archaeon]